MPDLNLNEQEWRELIEELNRSVPDEDMKDLFADDFDDKKEPEPPPAPPAPPAPPPDVRVKSEFEAERRARGSPGFLAPDAAPQPLFHVAELPAPALLPPALPEPGQGASAELSSAHQLQQMAAKQKLLQNPAPATPAPGALVGSWPAAAAHGAFGGAYPLDKAASPPGYSKADFGGSALLLGPGGNQGSPRPPNAGGPYLQAGHHHGALLGHTPGAGTSGAAPAPASVLDYGNTKPLSHYKADCGPAGAGKAALMASYLQQALPPLGSEQNSLFLLKTKAGAGPFRNLPASQEQTPPSVPVAGAAGGAGGGPAGAHGAPYLGGAQQAAVLKQQQLLLDQQKQREQQHHFLQRQQQLLAEQEKQQFQRHLTRPPPQYQDPNQSSFPQQVGAFPGSSAAVPGMSSCPRAFAQPGNLLSLGAGLAPAGSGPQERGVPPFSAGPPTLPQQPQPGGLYSLSPALAPPPAANGHAHLPRPGGGAGGGAYGQNSLGGAGLPPPHAKGTLAKPPAPRVSAALGAQAPAWQHQGLAPGLSAQSPGGAGAGPPFPAAAPAFHLPSPQAHLKVSGPPFPQPLPSRPLAPPGSAPPPRTGAPAAGAPQPGLPELGGFSQSPGPTLGGRGGLPCPQAYPVRTAGAAAELPCPFAGDGDLIDSLLKSRTSEEWMRDLDDLLGPQ